MLEQRTSKEKTNSCLHRQGDGVPVASDCNAVCVSKHHRGAEKQAKVEMNRREGIIKVRRRSRRNEISTVASSTGRALCFSNFFFGAVGRSETKQAEVVTSDLLLQKLRGDHLGGDHRRHGGRHGEGGRHRCDRRHAHIIGSGEVIRVRGGRFTLERTKFVFLVFHVLYVLHVLHVLIAERLLLLLLAVLLRLMGATVSGRGFVSKGDP